MLAALLLFSSLLTMCCASDLQISDISEMQIHRSSYSKTKGESPCPSAGCQFYWNLGVHQIDRGATYTYKGTNVDCYFVGHEEEFKRCARIPSGAGSAEVADITELEHAEQRARTASTGADADTGHQFNVAVGGTASQSSTSSGSTCNIGYPSCNSGPRKASFAVDGIVSEFYELGFLAQTLREENPWWKLTLAHAAQVSVVEISLPRSLCEPLSSQFIENKFKSTCEGWELRSEVMRLSQATALRLSASDTQGSQVIQKQYTRLAPTLVWKGPPVEVSEIKLAAIGNTALGIVEVKVFSAAARSCHALADETGGHVAGRCVHGKCKRGQCICDPDYIGVECDTYLLTAWRYTPLQLAPAKNFWSGVLEQQLLDDIHALQFPAGNNRCALHAGSGDVSGSGLGSVMMQMSGLLTTALQKQIVYVPDHPSLHFWFDGNQFCGDGKRLDECYLAPWTSCSNKGTHSLDFQTDSFTGTFSAEEVGRLILAALPSC
jgi:hypothetical protein